MSLTMPTRRPRNLAMAPELTKKLSVRGLRKLARLVEVAEDLTALNDGAMARHSEARTPLDQATDRLRILEEEARHGHRGYRGGPLDVAPGRTENGEAVVVRLPTKRDSQLEELRAEVEALNTECKRREVASNEVWSRTQDALRTLQKLRAYLGGPASGVDLQDAALPVVKRGDLAAQLASARKAVEELVHEHEATRRAPATDEEVLEGLQKVVAGLVARGRPDTSRAPAGEVSWPRGSSEVFTQAAGGQVGSAYGADVLAILAWTDPAALLKRLHAEALTARRETGAKPGLPRAERQRALATLAGQILEAERLEEAVIDAMDAAGTTVARRTDADPRALLGVAGPAHNA